MSNELPLAGRLRRLIATGIDAVLVPALSFVLVMLADVMEDAEDYANVGLMVLWVVLLAVASYLILNGYTLWRRGQTLGKLIMGIAIVPATANTSIVDGYTPAPLWKLICLRALFFPLLFLSVIPWMVLLPILDQAFIFGKRRRCLHDLVSGTIVVRV